jgi:hypothetical protein
MRKSDFKALQDEWYAKLAASGFDDIENPSGSICRREFREDLAKENYYRAVGHAIHSNYGHLHGRLMSPRQRIMMYVLDRHSDGASTRSICLELQAQGLRPNRRNTLNAWIKQFVHAVGLRFYAPEAMKNL